MNLVIGSIDSETLADWISYGVFLDDLEFRYTSSKGLGYYNLKYVRKDISLEDAISTLQDLGELACSSFITVFDKDEIDARLYNGYAE